MAGISWEDTMNYWVAAGGPPQTAAFAAAVADASSGLDPARVYDPGDGTTRKGLWQISSTLGALSTTDPTANARAAIQLANGGQDFRAWCSAWSDNNCGNDGGTYLGDGSNAVAALAQRGGTVTDNGSGLVTSALPTGTTIDTAADGTTPDASATTPVAAAPAKSSSSLVMLLLLLAVGLAAWYYIRKGSKPKAKAATPRTSPGASGD